MTGVAWYIGQPGAGKTTLAAAHACDLVSATGWPLVCIDSAGVAQLEHVPRAQTAEEAICAAWDRREHVAFTPRAENDVERVARASLGGGHVVLLVDEAAFWISSRRGTGSSLLRLMRAHRHAKVYLLLTTQHFSADVPQEAISCAPEIYVFACQSPAVLDRLEREYALSREVVKALPRGRYIRLQTGFATPEKKRS